MAEKTTLDRHVYLCRSIATAAHAGQFRRDGATPYVNHPEAVVERVIGDAEAESVAWLHDTIEDTVETANSLREQGVAESVIEAVATMTHRKGESYQNYLERVARNPLARKVKIADMLANLADSPSERQIRKYAKGLLFLLGD